MAAQMTGAFADPRMRLMYNQFLPAAQPYSGVPTSSNMNFNQGSLQPDQFQSKLQTMTQQQSGQKKNKLPWTMTKDERKSYDNIFRAWDAKRTGWISGDVARELFGQSGLSREQLLQIWHLADSENRGKLNIAEFHIAMALIYRALNGNEIPNELPLELIPSSTRDLSESVDFLKDLLKQDTGIRNSTALNLAEPGSNKDTKYTETRSFYRNPVERENTSSQADAVAYKHQESNSAGYRSRSRYLDRRDVHFDGQSAAEGLSEMKRQLENTQRMLERTDLREEEDRDLQNEMEDVRYAIRRLQDDIEYYNRREGPHAGEQRRKAERMLMQLLHERLPQLERRLERRQDRDYQRDINESRERDARNNDRYAHLKERAPNQSTASSSSARAAAEPSGSEPRAEPAAVSTPPASSSASAPPPKLSGAEREAWIRAEAQRRVQERMRLLGMGDTAKTASSSSSMDASVEQRLAAERTEAEARAAQADKEAKEREEARKARMRENKQVPTPPSRSRPPPPSRPNRPSAPQAPLREPESQTKLDSISAEPAKLGVKADASAEPLTVSQPARQSTNPFLRAQNAQPQKPEPQADLTLDSTPGRQRESVPEPEPEPEPEPKPEPKPEPTPPSAPASRPDPDSCIPVPQRATPSAPPSSRTIHLPPSHDEDWDEEEEDEDENPLSSRATRQHLAQQLFSGAVPASASSKSDADVPQAPAPPAPMPNLGGGMGDRNALLSQIRGGQTLKKTTTRDRSGAQGAGAVIGSASPPRGASLSSVPEPESSDDGFEPETLEPAEDSMVQAPGAYEPTPDMAPAAAPAGSAVPEGGDDAALGFDTSRIVHFRSIFPFEGGEGMLSFVENQVFLIHPLLSGALVEGDWTYGALVSNPSQKGLIPVAYLTNMEQGAYVLNDIDLAVVAAEALYDYEASTSEESPLQEGETVQVVDQSDENWWLIVRHDRCLMVPSNYLAIAS